MPNWVKNRIIVSKKNLDTLLNEHVKTNQDGVEYFDFNTVVPMPKELNIEFGSRSDDGLKLYMTMTSPLVSYFGHQGDKIKPARWDGIRSRLEHRLLGTGDLLLNKAEVDDLRDKYKDDFADVITLGRKQVDNLMEFGAINWYEWSLEHWGTKWECTDTSINRDKGYIEFDTAWDPAIPVFEELSRLHPEMPMALLYADEAIGCHTGYELIRNGKIDYKGTFKDGSKSAYEEAMDLWDCKDEFQYVPAKETYVHRAEMEM